MEYIYTKKVAICSLWTVCPCLNRKRQNLLRGPLRPSFFEITHATLFFFVFTGNYICNLNLLGKYVKMDRKLKCAHAIG